MPLALVGAVDAGTGAARSGLVAIQFTASATSSVHASIKGATALSVDDAEPARRSASTADRVAARVVEAADVATALTVGGAGA